MSGWGGTQDGGNDYLAQGLNREDLNGSKGKGESFFWLSSHGESPSPSKLLPLGAVEAAVEVGMERLKKRRSMMTLVRVNESRSQGGGGATEEVVMVRTS